MYIYFPIFSLFSFQNAEQYLVCLQNDGRWILQGIAYDQVCTSNTLTYINVASITDKLSTIVKGLGL